MKTTSSFFPQSFTYREIETDRRTDKKTDGRMDATKKETHPVAIIRTTDRQTEAFPPCLPQNVERKGESPANAARHSESDIDNQSSTDSHTKQHRARQKQARKKNQHLCRFCSWRYHRYLTATTTDIDDCARTGQR